MPQEVIELCCQELLSDQGSPLKNGEIYVVELEGRTYMVEEEILAGKLLQRK